MVDAKRESSCTFRSFSMHNTDALSKTYMQHAHVVSKNCSFLISKEQSLALYRPTQVSQLAGACSALARARKSCIKTSIMTRMAAPKVAWLTWYGRHFWLTFLADMVTWLA
eukprot:1137702-Pelagomonas_calceolata.AAC.4